MHSLVSALQIRLDQSLLQLLSQMRALPAEGKPPLPAGQQSLATLIQSSRAEASAEGRQASHYRLQLQLPGGQQVTLLADKPLQPGLQLLLQARPDGRFDLRPVPTQMLDGAQNKTSSTPASEPALATKTLATQGSLPVSPATANTSPAPQASLQNLLAAASQQLRQALPRQAPLAESLQQLQQLARPLIQPGQTLQPLPPRGQPLLLQPVPVQNSVNISAAPTTPNSPSTPASAGPAATLQAHLNALLQLVPQGNQPPTAEQIKAFIPLSGLFYEANLLRQTSQIPMDLKALLQQASTQLRQQAALPQQTPQQQQATQQVQQQVQSALARTQVLQQNSLQATQISHERGQPVQVAQMDLPYNVRGEWFQAQLELRRWVEDGTAGESEAETRRTTRYWEVKLSFNLRHWGKLHTLLKLRDSELKADIWVEEASTLPAIQEQLGLLEARLRRVGADVSQVECHLGKPAEPLFAQASNQRMIDTRI